MIQPPLDPRQDGAPELLDLFAVVGDDTATTEQTRQLEGLLRTDDDKVTMFVRFMFLHALLERKFDIVPPHKAAPLPCAIPSKAAAEPTLFPAGSLSSTFQSTVGYFASGWPMAYLVATVIIGIGLAIGAVTHVSQPEQVVRQHLPSTSGRGAGGEGSERLTSPFPSVVGHITGMVDCRFAADSKTEDLRPKTVVSLGDRFALTSGLLEITYDSGAKVILQGPVTYEVEAAAGGYLSVGKLTARIAKKAEESNPQSLIPNPLFVVRTPTATVTDLGTEFGVEVARSGETTSHVFRGSVRVQAIAADGQTRDDGRILRENESVRVEGGTERKIVVVRTLRPSHFIREIPKRTIQVFDLVDVVAGGDGFSGKRNAGIHPLTGEIVTVPRAEDGSFYGDGQYHRVTKRPFVDGIFVPDGRKGPVQVTSAGHRFDGFTNSHDTSGGYAWAGGVLPMLGAVRGMTAVPATLSGVDYSSAAHGLIYLHANKGITFDLEAIRRANPEYRIGRFRGVAGYTGPEKSLADLWVLVDGQAQFRRRQINSTLGAMPVVLPIRPQDRFLTLVATDGGDGIGEDFAMFGDPCLELLPKEAGSLP